MPATTSATTATSASAPAERIKRITVLISGSGSNLQAILDASLTPALPGAQVTYVLSSRSGAYGLERAAKSDPPVPTSVCALKTFTNRNPGGREAYDAEVARRVLASRPDVVVLAGWMHILSDSFLDILNGTTPAPEAASMPPVPAAPEGSERLPQPPATQTFPIPCINLHPALPGAFDGAEAIPRAFEAFKKGDIKHTGAMVHRVIKEVDRGEPLIVRNVEIKEEDTLADLENRIHGVEHEIIVEGTKKILEELAKEQMAGEKKDKKDTVDEAAAALDKLEVKP